jgi:hypothetical protein
MSARPLLNSRKALLYNPWASGHAAIDINGPARLSGRDVFRLGKKVSDGIPAVPQHPESEGDLPEA